MKYIYWMLTNQTKTFDIRQQKKKKEKSHVLHTNKKMSNYKQARKKRNKIRKKSKRHKIILVLSFLLRFYQLFLLDMVILTVVTMMM